MTLPTFTLTGRGATGVDHPAARGIVAGLPVQVKLGCQLEQAPRGRHASAPTSPRT